MRNFFFSTTDFQVFLFGSFFFYHGTAIKYYINGLTLCFGSLICKITLLWLEFLALYLGYFHCYIISNVSSPPITQFQIFQLCKKKKKELKNSNLNGISQLLITFKYYCNSFVSIDLKLICNAWSSINI